MTPDELKVRAENAARILREPLVVEALDLIERGILSEWETCPARDLEGREQLWKYYKLAKQFRGILQGVVESGKVAAFHQQEKRTFIDRAVDTVRNITRR